jgi:hypothetical protein
MVTTPTRARREVLNRHYHRPPADAHYNKSERISILNFGVNI